MQHREVASVQRGERRSAGVLDGLTQQIVAAQAGQREMEVGIGATETVHVGARCHGGLTFIKLFDVGFGDPLRRESSSHRFHRESELEHVAEALLMSGRSRLNGADAGGHRCSAATAASN